MSDLLERADPANGVVIDKARLRAKVDERIHAASPTPEPVRRRRMVGAIAVVASAAVALVLAQPSPPVDALPVITPAFGDLGDLPGINPVVELEMGGVKTMAVDGDTIWVVEALQRRLDRVDARQGAIVSSYSIDGYVEGAVVGGGHLWLLSYDNGG
ncbi:MAG: hypothetical protein OEX04_20525, partial [Acidimicrobiia bacterium]|nr:hypothetical protein [Acidimicrobiia bacterium]